MARGLYGAKAWVRGWQGSFPYGRQHWRCAQRCRGQRRRMSRQPRCAWHQPHHRGRSREHIRIGTMDYAETLPLRDGEVVLTFDDGPIPPLHRQGARHSCSRVRQGDLFQSSAPWRRSIRPGAARLRRGPHHRHAQHDASVPLRALSSSAPMPRSTMASRRPRRLWASGPARAVFSVSGLRPHRARPSTRRLARIDGLGRRRAG